MYAAFYNLKKEPFHITPDPEFLFLSPSHKEALGSIVYGVGQRKGFVLISGEVGVGKTTIIRSYLEQADKEGLKIIYIFNANVSFPALLRTVHRELGLTPGTDEVFEMVNQLHEALIEEYRKGCNVVLIIDEAQNMPAETLENLRMLSNLETSKEKLIQIVFSGQPEFEHKLDSKELRQLRQRIAIKSTILPLTAKESQDYIRHRLDKASAADPLIFTGGALNKIVKHAGGIPRVINILCENSLITAMGYRQQKITPKVVAEVIADFAGRKRDANNGIPLPVTIGVAVGVIALSLYFVMDAPRSPDPPGKPAAVPVREEPAALKNTVQRIKIETQPAAAENVIGETVKQEQGKDMAESPEFRIVKRGDTLSGLVEEIYGHSSKDLIAKVKINNASIRNVDVILVGERIVFPAGEGRSGKAHE
ncbi:MAG TPA: AAA family ATPase [Geobacteraceae bacterium]|nr:AAA family ATPase [Geobacteraceae bacterium]